MTSSSEQPPYEMQDAYILTKEDWLRLREHLTIGCTNQKVFLDTLHPHPAPLAKENLTVGMVTAYEAGLKEGARKARGEAYTKFMDEIRSEEVENMGYIDLDSIENIYGTLMAEQALIRQRGTNHE